jgi:NTP pyrophosphatase (non-canonical NTP hydrolase)
MGGESGEVAEVALQGVVESLSRLTNVVALSAAAGKSQEVVKKACRKRGKMTKRSKKKLLLELGDTLWYLTAAAHEAGFTLGEVAQANVDKLVARRAKKPKYRG